MIEVEVKEKVYRKKIDDNRDIEITVRNSLGWVINDISFCGDDRVRIPVWAIPHLIELLQKIYEDLEGGKQ